MQRSPLLSEEVVDVAAAADPVAAVLDAHRRGDRIALRTSGTSGGSRTVVRTTASWFDSFGHVTRLLGMGPRSQVWLPGPLASTMNLFAAVHAEDLGARVLDHPLGASHAVVTPAVLARAVAQATDLTDLTGVHVLVAGDRLSAALHARARDAGAVRVSHYYGAAELSFVAWGSHEGDLRAFPGVEVECRDGVVWARSPYLCERYDGPDGPLVRDADGFATVGDRGLTEDGFLRVLGRGEDAIVTAGATVLAADVETALEVATGKPVAVAGLPHPDLGRVVCGVVTDPGAVGQLRRAARSVLDPPQRPRRWFAVPDLPLTSAGKLDRDRLMDLLDDAHEVRPSDRPS